MPISIQPLEQVRLTTTFVDEDPVTGDAFPIEADSVQLYIAKWDSTLATPAYVDVVGFPVTPAVGTSGSVYYDWVPTESGKYRIRFEASIQTNTLIDERTLYVGPITTTKTLGMDKTYYFLGELDPLYVDISDILKYYPEGADDPHQIIEFIHWYSKEIPTTMLGTALAHDFIVASVMCELDRIHTFSGGMGGFSDSFTLGDLQIRNESGSSSSTKNGGRGGVSSWCDLAGLLRTELFRSNAKPVSFVKGGQSYDYNPIPLRGLKGPH